MPRVIFLRATRAVFHYGIDGTEHVWNAKSEFRALTQKIASRPYFRNFFAYDITNFGVRTMLARLGADSLADFGIRTALARCSVGRKQIGLSGAKKGTSIKQKH